MGEAVKILQRIARGRLLRIGAKGQRVAKQLQKKRLQRRKERLLQELALLAKAIEESEEGRTDLDPWHTTKAAFMTLLYLLIIIPAVVILCGCLFGGLLAWNEGWGFVDGFYYVISNLVCLATPLTDISPEEPGGKFLDLLVSVWA